MTARRVAIVDQGSNSTRLFLCEGVNSDGPVGERLTTVTALRSGAAADGAVADDAMARVRDCLVDYAKRIDIFVPDEVVVVGTSAVRDAPNRGAIATIVEETLRAELRVLAGPEEAELAYVGARLAVAGNGLVTVLDIGGGSTELVRGGPDGPHAAVSMDIGCVRHTELWLRSDPPTRDAVEGLCEEVQVTAAQSFDIIGAGAPLVGVAGTMTSLAAIALGAYDPERVHGHVLGVAEIAAILERLRRCSLDERRRVPGLHPDRAPAIVAGACIALGVLRAAGVDECRVSERDLLDGVALTMTSLGR